MHRFRISKRQIRVNKGVAAALFSIGLFILSGCTSLPNLDGINLDEWKKDKGGCLGKRITMRKNMVEQKDKLLRLSEGEATSLLGKADEMELSKRSEKFYKYYFSNAPSCDGNFPPDFLVIRFNAMGLAKEVRVNGE